MCCPPWNDYFSRAEPARSHAYDAWNTCFLMFDWHTLKTQTERTERTEMKRNGSSKDFERLRNSNFCHPCFFTRSTTVGQVTVKASSSLWVILNNKIWKPRTETARQRSVNWGKVMLMEEMEVAHQIHWKKKEKSWQSQFFLRFLAVVTVTNLYNLPCFIIHIEFRKGFRVMHRRHWTRRFGF